MSSAGKIFPTFIDRVIAFPDGTTYELLRPLTDFRKCHDGTPLEARVVFTCKIVSPSAPSQVVDEIAQQNGTREQEDEEYVIKVKVQSPLSLPASTSNTPLHAGPSSTTTSELKALELFRTAANPYTPHLLNFKLDVQKSPDSPLPGGYISYIVMTKMPGLSLFDLEFWSQKPEERELITKEFMVALKSIYALHLEPLDCALRNILWDTSTKTCSIIDFELYRTLDDEDCTIKDELKELQRWAVARRAPAISWWAEWKTSGH